ncbi:hypothetical protein CP556_12560 [Natrinema sp. CBA1119]|uniref:hypothetical protein n=1 Tax=Natrinema sp. CBA1119 TaxID=1608465 RepID=UPI000BF47320|nr:hypothetical protein [Natrinema sp. CBA1119]PGF16867.1 hypothetical protein CP556_12560 [Natrinema sp. CBA1119]
MVDEGDPSVEDDDPSAIRSIALSPDDAVDAYAYSRENPGEAVLRVTPPFHGRMRARIHVYRVDDTELTGAVHLSPADVIAEDVVAEYPALESTRDAADPDEEPTDSDEGTDSTEVDRIRERHAEAVEAWQARAREAIVETVTLETDDCSHRVELKTLG